ncbi:HsdR family type I site-specific deoxyribonuclease [Methanocaldococcus fervens]|uniref:type I site-specific deoxyribonuclease n=1 Tax=Methanocaldococcus fervens (strain DSM 4213 / JCM 15782 / AG86) TaxID=573064 RepID=C7P7R2_METFA|nr:HsdR family type I site-specific deoxyribonuclease [Methanocaldococcus fervens]ACV24594.1 type I site-specific deoxyribonuclease, HsdR family [Methanocaldococcus fervens AG86]
MPIPEIYVHRNIEGNLNKLGWKPLDESFYNEAFNNYIIKPILEEQLKIINDHIEEYKEEFIEKAINKLINEQKPENILDYIKNGILITLDKGRKGQVSNRVKLIDYKNIEKNVFNYAHELKFKGNDNIIPDFTLFVNGIPIIIIEAKRELSEKETYEEAINQINRYEREAPKLFSYVQFAIAYGDEKLYISTYPNEEKEDRFKKPYKWKNVKKEEDIWDLLKRERVLDIIKNFIFFSKDRAGRKTKIIPRYMQYWAVKKAYERIINYLNNEDYKNRGLIWHWQGSGKTFEIIYLAEIFYNEFKNRDPIVFIMVDRRELENQFNDDIIALQNITFKESFKRIESIEELKKVLKIIKESEKNINISGKGVYLVMMHKFDKNKLNDFINSFGSIDKKEILILRDEAHRTESGKFATLRNKILKNAIAIGFTGTPIHKKDASTFKEYAYPKEGEFYLDRFFIEESIKEGFTLPLIWRVVKPEDIKDISEEEIKNIIEKLFVDEEDADKIVVSKKEIAEKIKLSDLLKSESSIREASKYIANNILEDTENFKFKAMVIAQDRKSCILFKKYLDKYLKEKIRDYDENWTQVVITYQHNDEVEIENYKKMIENRYNKNVDELNKEWADKFKTSNEPKILIVNKKLLTGFDAPILKTIYLHQFLKDYLLLQASARANRPAKNKKYGLIVDLTGILIENYKKAIENYNLYRDEAINKDILNNLFVETSKIWESFLTKLDEFKKLFNSIVGIDFNNFIENLKKHKEPEKEFKKIIAKITLSDKFDYFYTKLRELIQLFEAVGAYGEKLNYYEMYEWLKLLSAGINKQTKPKSYKIPYNRIKKELIKYLEFDTYKDIASIPLDLKLLKNLKEDEFNVIVANIIYFALDTTKNKKEPIYRIIYNRIKELKNEYITRTKKSEEVINELINYLNSLKTYEEEEKSLSNSDKALKNILFYLNYIKNCNIRKLPLTEKTLKNLEDKKLIKPSDFDKIKKFLFIDLRNAIKETEKRRKMSNKIVEEIIKPIFT